ncbi:MAG TPA: hypothetical protein VLI39_22175 [Sedimentisphaerales bacterium]|nr:hypothetical protein [Sedimentisphaerales bacterium]
MNRNVVLFVIVAVIAGRMGVFPRHSGVASGQTTNSPVLQDNFDDNKRGTLWKVFGTSAKATVTEANKRLQFSTTSDIDVPFMGYISDKWWIDPNQDFQMKVDLTFNVFSYDGNGWVCFGLTPEATGPQELYAALGIGCSGVFQNYWTEWHDGFIGRVDFVGRPKPTVTMYISYDSWYDILYLSDYGYGPEGKWKAVSGFVKGSLKRAPLYVFLAAKSESMTLPPTSAYLDNFVIEKGKLGSPYQSTDPNTGGGQVRDIEGTVAILPSTIQRSGGSDKLTALLGLPEGITLEDWDPRNVPTLSPGTVSATAHTAFVWVDDSLKILTAFSKTKLMEVVTTNGEVEVHVAGKLKDGRSYAGSCLVTIR